MVRKKRGATAKTSVKARNSRRDMRLARMRPTSASRASSSLSAVALQNTLARIEKHQLEILTNQRKEKKEIHDSEEKIEEEIVDAETSTGALNEKQELDEIKRLEDDLKKGSEPSPLRRITYRDVTKGLVGAFIAVVNQFAFANGFQIAEHYSIAQSSLLLLTSFLIIVLFIYYTGFRKVDDKFVFRFLPIRAGVLYITSLFVSALVPFAFRTLTPDMPFSVIYGTVASISVLAVLGAGTADLIGKA